MQNSEFNLRDTLSETERAGVDALLRRSSGLISQAQNLSNDEKAQALEGVKALSRMFYNR